MNDFETAKQFFIEGLQLLEANNLEGAESRFARSLEIIPDRVSTLNNLSAIKIRLEKFDEAGELAQRAIAAGDGSPEAWANLGVARSAMNRHEEALQAYERALNCDASYARAWLNQAMTLLELKRFDEGLAACDRALQLNPADPDILYTKSRILKELGRADEAQKTYLVSLETKAVASPVVISERRASQKADVLVISPNPGFDGSFASFEELHRNCANFPGQLAAYFKDDFYFNFVWESDAMKPSARKQIPQPDLVINNCTNAELIVFQGNLPNLIALADSFGVPVLNHPARAVQTTRDESARQVGGISGVRMPKTARFSSTVKTFEELVHEIEAQFHYPLIARTLASQEGKGLHKVDSRDELVAALSSGLPDNFYVTQFVDSRGKNKFYRKIRGAVVGDEIILVRVDFDIHWNIHGRKNPKRVPFYLENLHLLDEEKRICKDPEASLGRSAVQALRAIRSRVPLDVFGMDFDVDPEGSVVFYEANATMNLISTAQKEVPNPKETNDRLKEALQRFLASMAARRSRNRLAV